MLFDQFPVFVLNEITLRELREDDHVRYQEYMSMPEVTEFLTDENIPKNNIMALNDIKYWQHLFRSKRSVFWAIAETGSNNLIGTVGFNNINFTHKKAEISYDLNYHFWGQNVMHRSVDTIINYLVSLQEIKRIQATVWVGNHRSDKLLNKLGFAKEGLLRNFEILRGESRDYNMFAKTF